MCFSPEASFAVGGALLPVGGYCLYTAFRKKPRAWGLALVPLGFGIQQISEGFVWLGIQSGDVERTQVSALVFLFFALAFWPFWFPVFAMLLEPNRRRQWLFGAFVLLGTGWFWALYLPVLVDSSDLLRVKQVHHSIQYDVSATPIYRHAPKLFLKVLYLVFLALPIALGSDRRDRVAAVMIGGSIVLAELFYHHAFISVWCFFAAVLAGYIAVIFYRMPDPQPNVIMPPACDSRLDIA